MSRTAEKELINAYCCGKFLAAAPAGSGIQCPDCGKWQEIKEKGVQQ